MISNCFEEMIFKLPKLKETVFNHISFFYHINTLTFTSTTYDFLIQNLPPKFTYQMSPFSKFIQEDDGILTRKKRDWSILAVNSK